MVQKKVYGVVEYFHESYSEYPNNDYIAAIQYFEDRDYPAMYKEYQNEDGQKVLEIQRELSDE